MSVAQRNSMIFIPGGEFAMGSDRFYPEEGPTRNVRVDPFWIDETPVTNAQFAEFVEATDYRTFAEFAPDPAQYPGLLPHLAAAASLVFVQPNQPVPLESCAWWHMVIGAKWDEPLGPGSSVMGLENHPVVHIAHRDALAYADWAGKTLPSEAEWEFAARGGSDGLDFAWGNELAPDGKKLANYWQGDFPHQNDLVDGWARTSPVRSYPPNGYGLHDMIGNTWEWTDDWFSLPNGKVASTKACCIPNNPRGGSARTSVDPGDPLAIPRKVLKGGSHLCAENYCQRYRPAARYPHPIDTTTSHIGFRCILRVEAEGSACSRSANDTKNRNTEAPQSRAAVQTRR